jgi:hypothetical protein
LVVVEAAGTPAHHPIRSVTAKPVVQAAVQGKAVPEVQAHRVKVSRAAIATQLRVAAAARVR